MVYGYARVSTAKQAQNGNSLDEQRKQLQEHGATEIFCDTCTGTKMDRPEFNKLMKKLQAGDMLIVTKLDRFARTLVDGATIAQDLCKRGVKLNIINMGIVDNSSGGMLQMNILLAFAQYERDMIVERTQSGKNAAREKGKRVDGRPLKYTSYQRDHALELLEQGNSYAEVSRITGISVSTLTREMRKRKNENQ